MRSNLLILFAVLSFLLLSCEPKDEWINQYDSKANAGDIAKICKQVSVECGKTKINYSGVDFEINCGECSNGYECRYNTCWDINECENPDLNNCPEHSTCANEEGSYSCICDDNYTWINSECVENPQEEPDTDDSGDSTPDNTYDSTDDSDSAPDNGDSTPDDDADTADSTDDSGDSEPDDSDTSAPDNNDSDTQPTDNDADTTHDEDEIPDADIDSDSENTLPECSATSGTPCYDSTSHLTWSSKASNTMIWQKAVDYCSNLLKDGYSDWRLPNINELRTLIKNCQGSQTGGTCEVSDPNHLTSDDWDGNSCYCEKVENNSAYYSKLGDNSNVDLWSSSVRSDGSNDAAWGVGFDNADVSLYDKSCNNDVRCVRSEIINDSCENHTCGSVAHSSGVCIPENTFEYSCACDEGYFWNGTQCKIMPECSASSGTPCKDSTNHLIWSPLASNDMTQPNALNYCENLVLYGFSDWHLPTIDELRTLIKNCPGTETNGACAISEKNGKLSESDSSSSCSCTHMNNNGGYYSKIGDDDTVSPWSSSSRSDDTERAWYVGFFAGKINNSDKSVLSDVRCVRNVE